MTEDDARQWIRTRYGVPRETLLARFAAMVLAENRSQNLIAPSTVDSIWTRHVVDGAQLIDLDTARSGEWVDIGSGAGFPGMVAAILTERPTVLVEPRRRRAEFLGQAAEALRLAHVSVVQQRAEAVVSEHRAATISARAVASVSALFAAAHHLSRRETCWVLPKGENAQSEVDDARKAWHGVFHVEQSITHPRSAIVIASGVRVR